MVSIVSTPFLYFTIGNLIKYKDYINAQDKQYKEAKEMLSK